jgi:hypothetical protein
MKAKGGVDVYIHVFLILALVGEEWSASRPGHSAIREGAPSTHWTGGWVGPRTSLIDMEKRKILPLPGLKLWPLSHPACSHLQYGLRYPSSFIINIVSIKLCILVENENKGYMKIGGLTGTYFWYFFLKTVFANCVLYVLKFLKMCLFLLLYCNGHVKSVPYLKKVD